MNDNNVLYGLTSKLGKTESNLHLILSNTYVKINIHLHLYFG